jgi:5-formyltetrahydrofolate cyclo-ligase
MTMAAENPASAPLPGDGDAADIAAAKHAVREAAKAARAALPEDARAFAAGAIAAHLLALPELAGARTVLAHAALPHEVDPALAVAELRDQSARICFPRVEAPGVLGVHEVADEAALVPGVLGIREPRADAPRVDPLEVDAVIVPGVAFDAAGNRLGYGGGYYDRLLATVRPDCALVGIAFDAQLVGAIPAEEHDVTVDVVVTPGGVHRAPTPRPR